MLCVEINPLTVEPGDKLVTRHKKQFNAETGEVEAKVVNSHKIQKIERCATQPECIHIDGGCYDGRFSTIWVVDEKEKDDA
jgi:predicted transcriptional regulator